MSHSHTVTTKQTVTQSQSQTQSLTHSINDYRIRIHEIHSQLKTPAGLPEEPNPRIACLKSMADEMVIIHRNIEKEANRRGKAQTDSRGPDSEVLQARSEVQKLQSELGTYYANAKEMQKAELIGKSESGSKSGNGLRDRSKKNTNSSNKTHSQDKSDNSESRKETDALQELHQRTLEAERMAHLTGQKIHDQQDHISMIDMMGDGFNTALRNSTQAFKDLQKKSANDQRYLIGTFLFFLWTVIHIWMKRLGIYWSIFTFWRWLAAPILNVIWQIWVIVYVNGIEPVVSDGLDWAEAMLGGPQQDQTESYEEDDSVVVIM